MSEIWLYHIQKHEFRPLSVGERVALHPEVNIRALDAQGSFFLEKAHADSEVILTCDNKAVIEIYQGQAGDIITLNKDSYFVLTPKQIAINKEVQSSPEQVEFFQDLEKDFLEKRLAEKSARKEKEQLFKAQVKAIPGKVKKSLQDLGPKKLSLYGALSAVIAICFVKMAFFNESPAPLPKQKKVAKLASAALLPRPLKMKAVETATQTAQLSDSVSVVALAKGGVKVEKRDPSIDWETLLLKHKTGAAQGKIADLEALLKVRMSGEKRPKAWKKFPSRLDLMQSLIVGSAQAIELLNDPSLSDHEKRPQSKFLLKVSPFLPREMRHKIQAFVEGIEKRYQGLMLEVEYDPAHTRLELQKLQSLLPVNHWLYKKMEKGLRRL